jgi:hypothetical protein
VAQKPPAPPQHQHNLPRNRRQPQLDFRMGRRTTRGRLDPRPLRPDLQGRSPRRHAREQSRRQPVHQTILLVQQHHHKQHNYQQHWPRHPLLHRLPLLQPTDPHPLGLLLRPATGNHRPHARSRRWDFSTGNSRDHHHAVRGADHSWTMELSPADTPGGVGFVLPPEEIWPVVREQWAGQVWLLWDVWED